MRSQSAVSTAEIAMAASPARPRLRTLPTIAAWAAGTSSGSRAAHDLGEHARDQRRRPTCGVGVAEARLAAPGRLDDDDRGLLPGEGAVGLGGVGRDGVGPRLHPLDSFLAPSHRTASSRACSRVARSTQGRAALFREQSVRPGSAGTNTCPVSFPVGGRAEGNRAMAEVVVITGSSAGVGRATARAFGARGAWVGLLARGRDGLEAAAREVEQAGGRALAVPTDVADPEAVEAAAARRSRPSSGRSTSGSTTRWRRSSRPSTEIDAGRVPPRHRGDLPRLRLRHAWRRSGGCGRATAARSSRSARRSPTAASRCSRPTAAPSTRSAASPSRCAAELLHDKQQRPRHDGADARP